MTPENLTAFIEGRRDQHLAELSEFLRIPSISAKSEHKPDIERGARWVADHLRAAGFKTVQIVPTNLHPLVYAESWRRRGSLRSFSTDIMMCSLPNLLSSGLLLPSNPPCATAIFLVAAPPTTKARSTFISRHLNRSKRSTASCPSTSRC